jgi:hypothetical protein
VACAARADTWPPWRWPRRYRAWQAHCRFAERPRSRWREPSSESAPRPLDQGWADRDSSPGCVVTRTFGRPGDATELPWPLPRSKRASTDERVRVLIEAATPGDGRGILSATFAPAPALGPALAPLASVGRVRGRTPATRHPPGLADRRVAVAPVDCLASRPFLTADARRVATKPESSPPWKNR